MIGRIGLMPRQKLLISFSDKAPATFDRVSKLGGYPNWVGKEAWPVDSFRENEGMSFFLQIVLTDDLFPKRKSDVAYIFIGTKTNPNRLWENNSVVFQSATRTFSDKGPFLERGRKGPALLDFDELRPRENYFESTPAIDIPFCVAEEDDVYWERYYEAISKPQIGGLPFLNREMLAIAEEQLGNITDWKLLFFASCDCEFPVLLTSVAPDYFVFVNDECTVGKVLGQTIC